MKPNRRSPPRILRMLVSAITACLLGPSSALAEDKWVAQPWPATLTVAVGWELLALGDVEFGGKYNYNISGSPIVEANEQHDGQFDGVRTDVMLYAPGDAFGWSHAIVGLRGFYTPHDVSTAFSCVSGSASAACDGTPVFDPSAVDNNSLGSGTGETVSYSTDRTVRHWGAALEASPSGARTGNLHHRFGIGYRVIAQDLDLTSLFSASDLNQRYDETLDTDYVGVYWGIDGEHALGYGLHLTFGGEAGLYWARTAYDGALTQTDLAGQLSQSLSLSQDQAAFIGALNLAIEKPFQHFTLSGFMRGEYYSYAPQMAYNQTDAAAGFPGGFSLSGTNSGTSIDDRDAWSLTIGGAMSVPLH